MLTVARRGPERLDIHLAGRVTAAEMRPALDALEAAAADMTRGRLLYRVSDLRLPALGALLVELSRMPRLLRLLRRFERCAVLGDAGWIRDAARAEAAVFRGVEIRAFAPEDWRAAEAWLAEGRRPAPIAVSEHPISSPLP